MTKWETHSAVTIYCISPKNCTIKLHHQYAAPNFTTYIQQKCTTKLSTVNCNSWTHCKSHFFTIDLQPTNRLLELLRAAEKKSMKPFNIGKFYQSSRVGIQFSLLWKSNSHSYRNPIPLLSSVLTFWEMCVCFSRPPDKWANSNFSALKSVYWETNVFVLPRYLANRWWSESLDNIQKENVI